MLTEDQAKERWCPFARHYAGERTTNAGASAAGGIIGSGPTNVALAAAAINRTDPISEPFATCMGSRCMVWRWWDKERLSIESESVTGGRRINPNERRGYCGLARVP